MRGLWECNVDTSIFEFRKSKTEDNIFLYCDINEEYKRGEKLENFIFKNAIEYNQSDLSADSFSFLSPQELKIKKKIERVGTPLKDWDIKIYRGILTGFNEAFIIDKEIRDKLIEEDPKSAEIINLS